MKLRTLLSALGLLTAVHGTAGCYVEWNDRDRDRDPRPLVPPTPDFPDPDEQPPTFTFARSRGCAAVLNRSACGVDRPLMAGVTEAIRISLPGSAFASAPEVRSSDPASLEVRAVTRSSDPGERFEGVIEVRGLRTGASELRVTGADGSVWRFNVRVDDPAGMILEGEEGNPRFDAVEGRLRISVGERVSLAAVPVNLNVERLYANDGVTWTAPDDRTVSLSFMQTSGERVVSEQVEIRGREPGTVTLQVRAGVVERTVVVEVTD